MLRKYPYCLLIFILLLILDQGTKVWVKTHMLIGDDFHLWGCDKVIIHFAENNGIAFGLSWGGEAGKIILTVVRILTVVLLYQFFKKIAFQRIGSTALLGLTLIMAGALGNSIDSTFYGVLFSASSVHGSPAEFLPLGGGYAPLLQGKVVDMIHMPLWKGTFPSWFPIKGGQEFFFFRTVFNFADIYIVLGALLTIISILTIRKSDQT